MFKILKMALAVSLIVALAVPAFAAAKGSNKSFTSDMAGSVYDRGANMVDSADGYINYALKTTFSLFNPCLDTVKFCSDRVFAPIQMPIDFVEGKIYRTKAAPKKAVAVPAPLKPVMPR